MEFWLVIAACLAAAVILGLGLHRWCPSWSARRASFVAAVLLPLLTIAWSVYLFFGAATGTAQSCGTETCGMAMVGAVFIAAWAVAVFGTGYALSLAALRLAGRR